MLVLLFQSHFNIKVFAGLDKSAPPSPLFKMRFHRKDILEPQNFSENITSFFKEKLFFQCFTPFSTGMTQTLGEN